MHFKKLKYKNVLKAILPIAASVILASCNSTPEATVTLTPTNAPLATVAVTAAPTAAQELSELTVHFIDVGQADSALVLCGGQSMLIDGGNVADSNLIVSYLQDQSVTSLDYIVCSHAHEDHVGGLSAPLSVMDIRYVYAPVTEADSDAYTTFKAKALTQVSEIIHPKTGDTVSLGSSTVEFFAPTTESADELNNSSVMCKITHGDNSFLFTGDAEHDEEQDILSQGCDVSADILKVGHHGSDSSTSYVWLREVMPEYAVISVGKDNSYGHPTDEVLSRLRDADVQVYRTDLQGDIIAVSDGQSITITTQKNGSIQTNPTLQDNIEEAYIGNKNTKKFHRPDCSSLPAEKNRVYLDSREEAISEGFNPCQRCNP